MLSFRDPSDMDAANAPASSGKASIPLHLQDLDGAQTPDETTAKKALPNWSGGAHPDPVETTPLRRPVNRRFLAGVLIGAAVLAAGFHLAHEYQTRSTTDSLMAQARQAIENEDLEAAAKHLSGYVDLAPDDVDAHAELALLLNETARSPRQSLAALLAMESVLRKDANRREVRRALVDVALLFGRYHDAALHLELLLADAPDDADLRLKLGEVYESAGQWAESAAAYQTVVHQSPRRIDAYERLAEILAERLDQPDEANKVIQQMMDANKGAYRAHLARARYNRDHGLLKSALIDARTAFQMAPDDPDVLLLIAELVAFQQEVVDFEVYFDPQMVRERLERTAAQNPQDPRLPTALAQLELSRGRADLAEQRLRTARQYHPDDLEHIAVLADILISRNDLSGARREIHELKLARAPAATLDYLEGRLAASEANWLDATRRLERVSSASLSGGMERQLCLVLAECYRQLGLSHRRLEMLNKAVDADGISLDARRLLADALVDAGQLPEALTQYLQLPAEPESALAEAGVRYLLNLRMPQNERDWTEVQGLLDRAATDQTLLPRVALLRASILVAQREPSRAQELLERATDRAPGRIEFWVARAELADRMQQSETAATLLATAHDRFGRRPELFLAKIRHLVHQGLGNADAELATMLQQRAEFPASEQPRLLRALAEAFSMLRDESHAQRLWEELAAMRPNDAQVWFGMLRFAADVGSIENAQAAVTQIRRIEGRDGPYSRMAEGTLLLAQARTGRPVDLERAKQLLLEADTQFAASTRLPLLLAEVELLAGNHDAAADCCLEAIERGQTGPNLIKRAFLLLYQRRRFEEAHDLVERFRGQTSEMFSASFDKLVTDVALRAGQFDRAVQHARESLSTGLETLIDQLWLGQVLWRAGRIEEAERQFQDTMNGHRDRPEAWMALVDFLARTDQREQALRVLADAADALPPERRDVTLGQGYQAVGEFASAGRHFQRALELDGTDPDVLLAVADYHLRGLRPDQAEPLVRQVLAAPLKDPARARQWRTARRRLATLLLVQPEYSAFREALRLLDENLTDRREADDVRLKAKLLATRRSRTTRREAIALLERLREGGLTSRSDQLLLVRLYVSLGDWSQGRDALLALLFGYGQHTEHLAFGVQTMLDHAESGPLVEQWLEQLKKAEPDAYRTTELGARLLIGRSKIDEALVLLEGACPADAENASACRRRLASVLAAEAGRLEFTGETVAAEPLFARAESLLRDQADDNPEQLLPLIAFLIDRSRIAEALHLCETAWKRCPAEDVAALCVRLLQTGRVDAKQSDMIWEQLQIASAAHRQSYELVIQMANAAQLRQDYKTAIHLYRATVEGHPHAALACNELALLLALTGNDRQESLRVINRAIGAAGPFAEFLDTRATIHLLLGNPQEALADLNQAIADDPAAGKFFHLAQVHAARDDMAQAADAYQRGVALGLQSDVLHPLERSAFTELEAQIDRFKYRRTQAATSPLESERSD